MDVRGQLVLKSFVLCLDPFVGEKLGTIGVFSFHHQSYHVARGKELDFRSWCDVFMSFWDIGFLYDGHDFGDVQCFFIQCVLSCSQSPLSLDYADCCVVIHEEVLSHVSSLKHQLGSSGHQS